MEIRRLVPHEFDQAGRVTAAAWAEYQSVLGREWWWEQYLDKLAAIAGRAEHTIVLGAFENDHVVGTLTVELDRAHDGRRRDASEPANLRMLAVDPAYRRRGVGLALMNHALELVRASDRKSVWLFTLECMEGAHRLYNRLGFTRSPEDDEITEGELTLECYRKTLR